MRNFNLSTAYSLIATIGVAAAFSVVAVSSMAFAQADSILPPLTANSAKQILALEAGDWDADITFPSNDPAIPSRKAKGRQLNRLRSGGMWMINEFTVAGTSYEGTGVWGFDRAKNRFSGIWVDNDDQQIRSDDGRWDATNQTMIWSSNVSESDGSYSRLLFTEKFEGRQRKFEMVALTRKGEVPLVRMTFTKRLKTAG
jgi:hypothetical protein